jgi:Domain of unknown function (DUF6438)
MWGKFSRQEVEHLRGLLTGNGSLFAKRRAIIFALVLLGLLLLIVLIGPTNLLLLMKPDLVMIELERRGCYGVCPIYSLQILGDGRMRYEGQRFVRVQGVQSARLNPGQVQELVTAFENINFFAMPDQLSYGIEDLEETRTCITYFSDRKCVEIRSTYPGAGATELPKVKELDNVIDRTAQVEQWVGKR